MEELRPLAGALGITLHKATFNDDLVALTRAMDVIVSTVPSAALEGRLFDLAHAPVFDVIYDPWPTPLTIHAAADGYATVGGHVMLAHQSFSQFEQFTGHTAPREQMQMALNEALGLNQ